MAAIDRQTPLRVAVLAGGESAEREISLASGICVAAALEETGHNVRSIDPAEIDLVDVDWRQFDVCFIALHGGAGEDGRVQQLLDSLHVRYTGSRAAASQLAMSKSASKMCFTRRDIPTPDYVLLHRTEPFQTFTVRAETLAYPLIIKPDAQGSSLGVGIARDLDELQLRVTESQFYDPFILVEKYIAGREITVAVLGREPLPLMEVVSHGGLFTYTAKYEELTTEYIFDPDLSPAKRREIESLALAACDALQTDGLVRVDFRLDTDERPWVLEVNTIPGMTERSMAPRAAAQKGIEMPQLCDHLIRSCLAAELMS